MITKDDIKAIKTAIKNGDAPNGRAWIVCDWRCIDGYGHRLTIGHELRIEGGDPEYVTVRYPIVVKGQNNNYAGKFSQDTGGIKRLVASDSYYSSSVNALMVLGNLLREGDELQIVFRIGNDSENLRNAGMTHDECDLLVWRKGKCIGNLRVDDFVGPRNTASMIDVTYRPERDGSVA